MQFVLTINAAILIELLILAIPGYFVLRDMQRAAKRFGLDVSPSELTGQKEEQYLAAARRVFEEDPKVAVFVYGHMHAGACCRRSTCRSTASTTSASARSMASHASIT